MRDFFQNLNNNNLTCSAVLFSVIPTIKISFGNRYSTLSLLIRKSKRNLNIRK